MQLSYDTIRHLLIEVLDGDSGNVITDYASEYGEPGYSFDHDETPMFLIGDWWCKCGKNPHAGRMGRYGRRDEPVRDDDLHGVESHHPRLWAQLESQGVEWAFYDEWTVIDDKAYRTQPDSYSWQSSIQYSEEYGDYLTPETDIEEWISWAVNDSSRCLMDAYRHQLSEAGFTQWEPHDPHQYQSGWHEGMDGDPKAVTAEIERWSDDQEDIVFVLDETSQFYVGFSAWTRPKEDTDGTE